MPDIGLTIPNNGHILSKQIVKSSGHRTWSCLTGGIAWARMPRNRKRRIRHASAPCAIFLQRFRHPFTAANEIKKKIAERSGVLLRLCAVSERTNKIVRVLRRSFIREDRR